MNQRGLATRLQKDQGLTKRQSEQIVGAIVTFIKEELRAGHKVRIRNFGTFFTKKYSAKIYQDVHTKKIKTLPDRKKVKFSASKNILG